LSREQALARLPEEHHLAFERRGVPQSLLSGRQHQQLGVFPHRARHLYGFTAGSVHRCHEPVQAPACTSANQLADIAANRDTQSDGVPDGLPHEQPVVKDNALQQRALCYGCHDRLQQWRDGLGMREMPGRQVPGRGFHQSVCELQCHWSSLQEPPRSNRAFEVPEVSTWSVPAWFRQ
jgi:hypothetical protein